MKFLLTQLLLIAGLIAFADGEDAAPVKAETDSVGLFKNGLSYIKKSVTINEAGKYILTDVPEPVYGTFSVESDADVSVLATSKYIPEKIDPAQAGIGDFFAGKEVKIYLKGEEQNSPLTGVLLEQISPKKKDWNRTYNNVNRYNSSYGAYYPNSAGKPEQAYLRLKTKDKIILVRPEMISYISSAGCNTEKKVSQPVFIVNVKSVKEKPAKIRISYLTKGVSWAASYLLDLKDDKNLVITQKAVIKNELMDMDNVDINLISGFPHIKYSNVVSPLSLNTDWNKFFMQLNSGISRYSPVAYNCVQQQRIANVNVSSSPFELAAGQDGGVDIYYNNIGKRSMKEGDSLSLNVARKEAGYEKVVLWNIPDNRTPEGRYINDYERRRDPEKYDSAVWDSIRFRNPFKFPMTTAAAVFVKNDEFLGESTSYWVNPGEETLLSINKALSIGTKSTEKEIPGKRERIRIFGNDYQKSQVSGTLILKNYRQKASKIIIKRGFSGKLLEAADSPKCELREEGVYSINERNELTWELDLEAGKEKTITFSYEVLVDI
jgi:hypothetical protein